MKIGLLAPEDSGKSSFLVALYGVLVYEKGDLPDYPMRFSVPDPLKRGWLDDHFSRLVDEFLIKSERFPKKTAARERGCTEYVFRATHKSSKLEQDITLIDFAGEMLPGALDKTQLPVHEGIMRALHSCDAFIVLLDAPALAMQNRFAAKRRVASSHINEVLRATAKHLKGPFSKAGVPIAFCPSRLDLLDYMSGARGEHLPGVFSSVKTLFPEFFAAQHFDPVLITGLSLGSKIAGRPGEEKDNSKMGGSFAPEHIETAFEFCFSLCAYSACATHAGSESLWKSTEGAELSQLQRARNMDLLESLKVWWNKVPTWTDTPAEYFGREAQASHAIAARHTAEADRHFTLGNSMVRRLASSSSSHYKTYVEGRPHRFVPHAARGTCPLELLDK